MGDRTSQIKVPAWSGLWSLLRTQAPKPSALLITQPACAGVPSMAPGSAPWGEELRHLGQEAQKPWPPSVPDQESRLRQQTGAGWCVRLHTRRVLEPLASCTGLGWVRVRTLVPLLRARYSPHGPSPPPSPRRPKPCPSSSDLTRPRTTGRVCVLGISLSPPSPADVPSRLLLTRDDPLFRQQPGAATPESFQEAIFSSVRVHLFLNLFLEILVYSWKYQ